MEFTFELLSLKNGADFQKINQVYSCWSEIWGRAFADLGVISNPQDLASDDFNRLDEIGALFDPGGAPVGVLGFRKMDLSVNRFRDDSYFKKWKSHHLLRNYENETILIACQAGALPTIKKTLSYQKSFQDQNGKVLSVREILVGLSVMRLLTSPCRFMLATPRLDRGVGEASNRWGGKSMIKDVPTGYGDLTDLIVFDKIDLGEIEKQKGFSVVNELYKNIRKGEEKYEITKVA